METDPLSHCSALPIFELHFGSDAQSEVEMLEIQPDTNLNAPLIDAVCNELAQPLTVMTSLVELWEQGLAEPDDLVLMKEQINRMGAALKELRAMTDEVQGPSGQLELSEVEITKLLSSMQTTLPGTITLC